MNRLSKGLVIGLATLSVAAFAVGDQRVTESEETPSVVDGRVVSYRFDVSFYEGATSVSTRKTEIVKDAVLPDGLKLFQQPMIRSASGCRAMLGYGHDVQERQEDVSLEMTAVPGKGGLIDIEYRYTLAAVIQPGSKLMTAKTWKGRASLQPGEKLLIAKQAPAPANRVVWVVIKPSVVIDD